MRRHLYLFLTISLLIFNSCTRSQAEIAAIQQDIENIRGELRESNASLEAANDKMERIKEFHVLRTQDEREQQIQAQSQRIQELNDKISQLSTRLAASEKLLQ